jgi:hypothetical protein
MKENDYLEYGRNVREMQFALNGCNIHHVPSWIRCVIETESWRTFWLYPMRRIIKFETFSPPRPPRPPRTGRSR